MSSVEEIVSTATVERREIAESISTRTDLQEVGPLPSLSQHPIRCLGWVFRAAVGLVCLIALLSLAAAIPVVSFFAMGYLMESQARVARTGKFRSAFYLLPAAQRLGGMLLAASLFLIPIQLLAGAARDSWLLAPSSRSAWIWTSLLVVAGTLVAAHLLLAIGSGGSWWSFFRPVRNARRLFARLRQGDYWREAHHAIWEFAAALRLPHLFSMGLLAFAAAYVWMTVPIVFFTMLDDVTSRWQIVVCLAGGAIMTLIFLWLPMLIAHVAVEGRLASIFELATVRRLAGRTPFCWALATAILLACSVLPLLYAAFFKIQIPPHAAKWDLMLVFLVSVVPARVLVGWVYHRATARAPAAATWPWRIWQWTNGIALCIGAGYYVYFLNLAATGGELGERSIWQMHAVLLPLPF